MFRRTRENRTLNKRPILLQTQSGERTEDETEQYCMSEGLARTASGLLVNAQRKLLCQRSHHRKMDLPSERMVGVSLSGQGMQVREE